jgi:glycosyltransferase involved in cell wall biosynthesis
VSAAAPEAAAALQANDDGLQALIAEARARLAAGRLDAAAALAQAAAQHAWMNHAGRFASPELEELLGRLAERCAPGLAADERAPLADPRDVLHVATQCYPTGGSTREIVRWFEQDPERRQRLAITRQETGAVPPFVADAAAPSGGAVLLDRGRGGLMARAAALRALAATTDAIVLHVHPYDVVPVIALAGIRRPPVVLVNHADHVFWLGTSIADTVLHMRESGRELAEARRGLEPARSAVMARPLKTAERTHARDEAKRALGLDPESVVLVTAADATKYRPIGRDAFLPLVEGVLARHPRALLVAAGPADEGDWAAARERTGGRVRALGRLPEVSLLHEAADVYLDSFPFSSLTSLLEAGCVGVPAITYRGHPEGCGVLGADVPGVDPYISAPADPAAFAAALDRAIADAAWRADTGARTAAAIRASHTGAGWRADVDAIHAQAARLRATAGDPRPGPAPFATEKVDEIVRDVMGQTPFARGVDGARLGNLGLLPLRERAASAVRLARGGCRPGPRDLVPEWLRPAIATARRRLAVGG